MPVQHVATTLPSGFDVRCWFQTHCEPLVLRDTHLDAVYGNAPIAFEPVDTNWDEQLNQSVSIAGAMSVPRADALVKDRLDGRPLPAATWSGVAFIQVDSTYAEGADGPPTVRTIFLRQTEPYTEADHQALAAFAAEQAGFVPPTVVTSVDRSADFAQHSIGTAPWAPVDPSMRWSIVLIAAILALMAVVGTSSIVAIDRWRDNERLEVLGASPAQLRVAAALHSWVELGLAGALAAGLTVLLVAIGVHEFNRDADIEVPFTAPWTQLVFLVVVIPLVAMTVAALVARPLHIGSRAVASPIVVPPAR